MYNQKTTFLSYILSIFTACLFTLSHSTHAQNLFRSSCQGNTARVDSLLSNASIDTVDYRGRSLLHWAVACKKTAVFDYLIDKGIAINSLDNDGVSASGMAVKYNNPELFDRLVSLQRDGSWKQVEGAKLMQYAVFNGDTTFITRLLKAGIDIDAKNDKGSTPLEIAKRIKASNVAEWLIKKGADPSLVRTMSLSEHYVSENSPGNTPQLFAPNFISTEEYEFGSVFNKAGNEFYFGVDVGGDAEIRYSKIADGVWTSPELLLPEDPYDYNDPFLSTDENRLYFISRRPIDENDESSDHDIWFVERDGISWSKPINAGPDINTVGNEYYISFTNDGTMYFSSNKHTTEDNSHDQDVYYSKFEKREFQPAVKLSKAINTEHYEADVFTDPDEKYMIFCSTRPDGYGRGDLYISFKNTDGTWTEAKNMGSKINTVGHELCPFVTADGKYFLYTSREDIYWVETSLFESLK